MQILLERMKMKEPRKWWYTTHWTVRDSNKLEAYSDWQEWSHLLWSCINHKKGFLRYFLDWKVAEASQKQRQNIPIIRWSLDSVWKAQCNVTRKGHRLTASKTCLSVRVCSAVLAFCTIVAFLRTFMAYKLLEKYPPRLRTRKTFP